MLGRWLDTPTEAGLLARQLAVEMARVHLRLTSTEHQDAAALLERSGGPDTLRDRCRQLLAVVAARPTTRAVVTVDGEVDQAYADLLTPLAT